MILALVICLWESWKAYKKIRLNLLDAVFIIFAWITVCVWVWNKIGTWRNRK